jgi:hypothetical protein
MDLAVNDQAQTFEQSPRRTGPPWYGEISSGLSIRSHFIVTGNVRDLYPLGGEAGTEFVTFAEAVWRAAEARGCVGLLVHDPVDGLRLHAECDPRLEAVLADCGIRTGAVADTPDALGALAGRVADEARLPIALLVDYASALLRQPGPATERLFVRLDKASRGPAPERPEIDWDCPARNPVFWIAERAGDFPAWFTAQNAGVRKLILGMPDLSDRIALVDSLVPRLGDAGELEGGEREARVEQFAVSCEGMTLAEMRGVVELARTEGFGLRRIGEALRSYKIGTTRNPWTSSVMRSRVRNSETLLQRRVLGQERAVEKTYDILVRSIMGLSGSQTSSRGNRPRGVLFFVGPTGVGKTELAKAVTEVLFGDETAMQRFDMSEFVNEESIGRLIGPPPGAPGHEHGGELVNRVRERPFSVFLFDEIEKGHPRILDAFLQILDDGRLTDTRGETGHFSESLIIFTSNVGIVGGDRSTNMGQNILPSDAHDVLEEKLTQAVSNHFRYELKRPELMNRMGQNIVAFEFIHPKSAAVIFEALVKRVLAAVLEEHGVEVTLSEEARGQLMDLCISELGDGGRGVGNRIETHLINPLSRLLFRRDGAGPLTITGVEREGREVRLVCEGKAAA